MYGAFTENDEAASRARDVSHAAHRRARSGLVVSSRSLKDLPRNRRGWPSGCGDLVNQIDEMRATCDRLIEVESNVGRVSNSQPLRELMAEKATGMTERAQCITLLLRGSHDADKYFCMSQVRRKLDIRDACKADARILQPFGDRLAEHFAHSFVDAPHALAGHVTGPRRP